MIKLSGIAGLMIAVGSLQTLPLQGGDWARFRGPNGSGTAADANPPVNWSDSQNIQWKTQLPGAGSSSSILVGNKLFLTCWSGESAQLKRHLICVDPANGKVQWDQIVPGEARVDPYQQFLQEHGYASHTPVSDGERVYAYFGKAGALAFDLNGKKLWQVNLGQEANAKNWGSASSPIVYQDAVIFSATEESHAIYALDKKTGKQLWKSEGAALEYVFGTPIILENGDRPELIVSAPNEIWAVNPDTGKLRWFALSGLPGNIAPSVVAGPGMVFAFGGYPQTGAVAVKVGGKGDVSASHVAWSSRDSSYIPTPVLHEGRLYVVTDAGFALCLDAKNGSLVYKERLPGATATGRGGKPFYASPVLANGNLYAPSRRNGTFVIAAQPDFKLVAHNTIASDDSQFNASPALSGKQMYLRSDRYLYCISTETRN